MHRFFCSVDPARLLRLEPLEKPGDRLVHPLVRPGEDGAFLFFIRSVLEAPWLGLDRDSECRALLPGVSSEKISHSMMAAGKWFLFQSSEGDQFFVDHGSILLSIRCSFAAGPGETHLPKPMRAVRPIRKRARMQDCASCILTLLL